MIKDMFIADEPWQPERRSCPHKGMHWSGRVFPRPGPDWHREYKVYPDDHRDRVFPPVVADPLPNGHVLGCVCIADFISSLPNSYTRMDARCKPAYSESDPGPIEMDGRCKF